MDLIKFEEILKVIEEGAPSIKSDGFYTEEDLDAIENYEDSETGNMYGWMDQLWPMDSNFSKEKIG